MITPKVLSGFKDRLPKDAIQKAQLLSKVSSVSRKSPLERLSDQA
ncbi:hypothetical protein AOH185_14920 [Helicobacter pylori]